MENINLSIRSLKWIYDSARWARFIAILGVLFIGVLVIIGVLITPLMSYLNQEMTASTTSQLFSRSWLSIIYLFLAAVYFFPIYYLYRFSNGIIIAYKAEDEGGINSAFVFLKKHFKFIGIMLILLLAAYTVAFAFSIFSIFPS